MKFAHIALAASLAVGLAPAFAADQSIDLSSGSAYFTGTAPLLAGGSDVLSFINLAAGTYNFSLSYSTQFISGFTADLNGQDAPAFSIGSFNFGGLVGTSSAPFVLTLTGTPEARGAYSGQLSVTAVPEPESWALMLAGLGAAALMSRRRRPV
jgi:PEP-CTERM motif